MERRAGPCHLVARMLDYHLILPVLVPLVLLVLVTAATVRHAVLLVLAHIRHVRVDALSVQGWQGPRERGRLEVGDGRMPGTGIARSFGLAAFGGQFLDRLQRGSVALMTNKRKKKKERSKGGRREKKRSALRREKVGLSIASCTIELSVDMESRHGT